MTDTRKPDIEIVVRGARRAGKSTLGGIIANLLSAAGAWVLTDGSLAEHVGKSLEHYKGRPVMVRAEFADLNAAERPSDKDHARRSDILQNVPAEKAIRAAMHAVEALPPDDRLTDAVVLLDRALQRVGDYVDATRADRSSP